MHKLSLLAEEQTREDTLESIVESIMKNIPQLRVSIERYNLPREKVLRCKDWYYSDSGCKNWTGSGQYVDTIRLSVQPLIQGLEPLPPASHWYPYSEPDRFLNPRVLNPDIDILEVYGKDRNGILRRRRYYNMGRFVKNSRKDLLTLITTHNRWFLVKKTSDKWWNVSTNENWYSGEWLNNYNLGIAPIAKRPTHENNVTALHELGHYFGFDHHHGCVMNVVGRSDWIAKIPEQFCKNCKKVIQQYFE